MSSGAQPCRQANAGAAPEARDKDTSSRLEVIATRDLCIVIDSLSTLLFLHPAHRVLSLFNATAVLCNKREPLVALVSLPALPLKRTEIRGYCSTSLVLTDFRLRTSFLLDSWAQGRGLCLLVRVKPNLVRKVSLLRESSSAGAWSTSCRAAIQGRKHLSIDFTHKGCMASRVWSASEWQLMSTNVD